MTRAFDMGGETVGDWDENTGEGWLDWSGHSTDDLEEGQINELGLDTLAAHSLAARKSEMALKKQLRTAKKADKPAIQHKIDKRSEGMGRSTQKYFDQMGRDDLGEGKFTVNAKTGAKLNPRTGEEIPGSIKPPKVVTPRAPAGPRRDSNGLTKDDYSKVWRKIEDVVSNIFPDGDPIDWLAPWLNRSGVKDWHVGEVLDKACKMNGWKDMYEYYDSFKTDDYGYNESVEETPTGIVHRSKDKYGAGEDSKAPGEDRKVSRDLTTLNRTATKKLSNSILSTDKVDEGQAAKDGSNSSKKIRSLLGPGKTTSERGQTWYSHSLPPDEATKRLTNAGIKHSSVKTANGHKVGVSYMGESHTDTVSPRVAKPKVAESAAGKIITQMHKFARNGEVKGVTECIKQLKPYADKLNESTRESIAKAITVVKRNAK